MFHPELEPKIRATISELIDGFADKGACDAAYDYGRIYPVKVFMDLMGFPFEKFEAFLEWEYAILHSNGNVERMSWGVKSALTYLRAFIEEVRKAPNENDVSNRTRHLGRGRTASPRASPAAAAKGVPTARGRRSAGGGSAARLGPLGRPVARTAGRTRPGRGKR